MNDSKLNASAMKDDDKKSEKNSSSFLGSSVTKNPTALLGYVKINQQSIEQNCKFIKKYLKNIHLDEQFKQNTSFKLFPEDVVKDNGKVIYILIKNSLSVWIIGNVPLI